MSSTMHSRHHPLMLGSEKAPLRESYSNTMSQSPPWLRPYLQLIRFNKAGWIIVYAMHAIGALHAGIVLGKPPLEIFYVCLYMGPVTAAIRWANFVWNDICDREFDAKVDRCRLRPLAHNDISVAAATVFCAALVLAYTLLLLPLPKACIMYMPLVMFMATCYPLSKRWFNYPQLVLAVVMPCALFTGAAAAGQTPLPHPTSFNPYDVLNFSSWTPADSEGKASLFYTYSVLAAWTIVFELIYSFQDARWDGDAGVGTMTSLFSSYSSPKVLLHCIAVAQAFIYQWIGVVLEADMRFWPFASMAVLWTLVYQLVAVDLSSEESCRYWFINGPRVTGPALMLGFFIEYYLRT